MGEREESSLLCPPGSLALLPSFAHTRQRGQGWEANHFDAFPVLVFVSVRHGSQRCLLYHRRAWGPLEGLAGMQLGSPEQAFPCASGPATSATPSLCSDYE